MNDNTIRDDQVLVEGEEVGVEVARPTQLEERDPTAGLDDKDGDTAVKYGEDIGKIIADIPKGGHVHTHNCKTKRW